MVRDDGTAAVIECHAESVSDAIHEGKIRYDRARVVDRQVVQPLGTESIDVRARHRRRAEGHDVRITNERAFAARERGQARSFE